MSLGRLYQGKYVPPERQDGLLLSPQEETVEREEEDGEAGTENNACTTSNEDIDLD